MLAQYDIFFIDALRRAINLVEVFVVSVCSWFINRVFDFIFDNRRYVTTKLREYTLTLYIFISRKRKILMYSSSLGIVNYQLLSYMIKIRDSPITHMIYAVFYVSISSALVIDYFLGAWLSNEFEREIRHLELRARNYIGQIPTLNIDFSNEAWENYCKSIERHEINTNTIFELIDMINDYYDWHDIGLETKLAMDIFIDKDDQKIFFSEKIPTEEDKITVTYCWSP